MIISHRYIDGQGAICNLMQWRNGARSWDVRDGMTMIWGCQMPVEGRGSPTKSRLTNARPQNRSLITDKIAPTNARLTYARALTKWRHQQTVARASMYADPLTCSLLL
jgi:hypothetical protein